LRLDRGETPDYCRVIDGALSRPEIGESESRNLGKSGKLGKLGKLGKSERTP